MNRLLLLAVASMAFMSSCAYTGDPNQGGLFGWSQGMANERLDAREARLNELDRANAYQRGRTSALRAEEARLRNNY